MLPDTDILFEKRTRKVRFSYYALFLIVEPVGDLGFLKAETAGDKSDGFVEVHALKACEIDRALSGAVVQAAYDITACISHIQSVLAVIVKRHLVSAAGTFHMVSLPFSSFHTLWVTLL